MTAHRPKLTLTPEIIQRFADYYNRPGNGAWGIFHVYLDDGNQGLPIEQRHIDEAETDEERELLAIFAQLTYSQRVRLGVKAEGRWKKLTKP